MKKCPVCDYVIKDQGIEVTVNGKKVVVCCQECADKARKQAKTAKRP